MPPTPDNQPGGDKPDGPGPYGQSRLSGDQRGRGGGGGGGGGGKGGKLDRRMSLMDSNNNNKSMLLRSQTQDFDHNRWLFESKGKYGIGNAYWSPDDDTCGAGMSMADFMDKPWKPLTRKVPVPGGILSPYRYVTCVHSCMHVWLCVNIYIQSLKLTGS